MNNTVNVVQPGDGKMKLQVILCGTLVDYVNFFNLLEILDLILRAIEKTPYFVRGFVKNNGCLDEGALMLPLYLRGIETIPL